MLFGAHVSVAGGYGKALDYALSVGCECMQIFAKSPRQWKGGPIKPDAAQEFVALRAAQGFGPVFTHTAYLINLSTTKEDLYEKSIEALADELTRASMLGADGVVTHVGNVPDGDRRQAARRVGEAIVRAFDLAGGDGCEARLLLENTAGAGSTFGSTFAEIGASIAAAKLPAERLGMCLDTCHAFAFGYPVDEVEGWYAVVDEIDSCVGIERLGLIHANDCKYELGTFHDRHEWIGDGHVGLDGFRAMICVPELRDTPVVTEMPGDVPQKDAVNVARLRALRDECRPSQ